MSKHEFYADPTLFDHWQSSASNWLCLQAGRFCPYAWTFAFAGFGTLLAGVSLGALEASLQTALSDQAVGLNQMLAQGVTVAIGLVAAQALFRRALDAWPREMRMPREVLRAARCVGWRPPRRVAAADAARDRKPVERDAVQTFFAGVREAGVNVAIARALFAAGIRSPHQLRLASDGQLARIRGVGPATVQKLRRHFGALQSPAGRASSER